MSNVRVKYIGSAIRFPELAITGQQQVWHRGESGFVTDTNAALLVASGQFAVADTPHTALVTDVTGASFGISGADGYPMDPAALGVENGDRFIPGIPLLKQPLQAELGTAALPNNTLHGINITGVVGNGANGYPAPIVVMREGVSCIEMVFAAVGTITVAKKTPTNFPVDTVNGPYGGALKMTYEIESAFGMRGTQPNLLLTDDTLSTGMQALVSIGSANGWSGPHEHTPMSVSGATIAGASDWQPRNGGSWATAFTHVVAKFACVAEGVGTKVWLYSIVANERRSLPSVIIVADDGHMTWFDLGLPTLYKYGLRCDMAFIRDYAELGRSVSSAAIPEWQAAVAMGNRALIHGPMRFAADGALTGSMRDYATPSKRKLGQTWADAVYADVTWNQAGLVLYNLDPTGRGQHVYVLPRGEHQDNLGYGDKTVETQLIKAGIKVCRLAGANLGCTGFAHGPSYARQPLYTPIIGHSGQFDLVNNVPTANTANENTNIANLIAVIQSEVAKGRNVIIMLHQVTVAETTATLVIQQANLEKLCAAIAALINAGQARCGSMQDLVPRVVRDKQLAIA